MATLSQLLDALTDSGETASTIHTAKANVETADKVVREIIKALPEAATDPNRTKLSAAIAKAQSLMLALQEKAAGMAPTVKSIWGHKVTIVSKAILTIAADIQVRCTVLGIDIEAEMTNVICQTGKTGYVKKATQASKNSAVAHGIRYLLCAAQQAGVVIADEEWDACMANAAEKAADIVYLEAKDREARRAKMDAKKKAA
jgi:hypothetical protein